MQDKRKIQLKRANLRYGMPLFQYIAHKTGKKPCECRCKLCQSQCHTPCLGTPQDILKLIDNGYGERLKLTGWAGGIVLGLANHLIAMVQARKDGEWCTFFDEETGLCELHDKGLKPTEGRLSSHNTKLETFEPKKSIAWNVAKEWEDERNNPVIAEIVAYMRKRVATPKFYVIEKKDVLRIDANGNITTSKPMQPIQ